jgi:hypothetical protein
MILNLRYEHTNYYKDIFPYMAKIFLDTSIMKIFIDGFIKKEFSKKIDNEYENLISLFERLKLRANCEEEKSAINTIKWNKFWVTPQIFTEICSHFYCDYNRRGDFKRIIDIIIPVFKEMNEKIEISKEKIIELIENKKPIIELGDFSIFIAVDDITKNYGKVSVLAKDRGISERFENYPNVLMIDYEKSIFDLSY